MHQADTDDAIKHLHNTDDAIRGGHAHQTSQHLHAVSAYSIPSKGFRAPDKMKDNSSIFFLISQ